MDPRLLKTGWSSAITDYIRDMEEAEVYIKAGLVEGRVNGKPVLLNPALRVRSITAVTGTVTNILSTGIVTHG